MTEVPGVNTTAQVKLEPGVFSGMSEAEYFALPCVSNSRLTPLLKSPAHCRWQIDHPKPPTDAMTLGSAVDCLVFSPTLFNERFAVAEQCCCITLKKVQCSKTGIFRSRGYQITAEKFPVDFWYCSIHADQTETHDSVEVLSPDQSSTAYAMAKAVIYHDGAQVLLSACEEFQLSLVWKENSLLCKGRLDGLSRELKTIIDLKTCADASPEAFSRKVADFGYHRQAAMYLRAASFHGIDIKNFVIIAVESEPPHAVALYTLTERTSVFHPRQMSPADYGDHQLLRLLDLYERCEASGEWPGYSEKPEPISLPKWAEMLIERE